ncbi:unnamed protein product [Brassica napus]|uniref:(rape) hypothetical protein n=3 Tax=Brassica TaxID=3705 RepID=A0A816ULG3_BRANA|nr:unnamed protein product [Brassica napus]
MRYLQDPTTKIRPRPSKPDRSDTGRPKRHRFCVSSTLLIFFNSGKLLHFFRDRKEPSTATNPKIPDSSIFFVSSSFSVIIEFAHLRIDFMRICKKVMKGNKKAENAVEAEEKTSEKAVEAEEKTSETVVEAEEKTSEKAVEAEEKTSEKVVERMDGTKEATRPRIRHRCKEKTMTSGKPTPKRRGRPRRSIADAAPKKSDCTPHASKGRGSVNHHNYQSTVRRSALFLCVEASRREASTMLQLRTQAIRALMKRWNIPHVSIDSSPHALVPNAGDEARSSNHSNIQEKLVTTKPQSAGDEARRSSHSNIQEKLVTTKPQSAGDDNVDRRSSHSNIPSQHSFEADLDPPTQQRVRKLAERFSTIEQQPFSCMCGQKFYAKSNLTTHKKKCLASKEEVDEEEDLAWAQKKRRSGGY